MGRTPPTRAAWLAGARGRLAARGEESALEAELLLRHATGLSRAALVAWPDATLAPAELERLAPLLARRLAGEPLAYVLGHREFWSLELEVGPAVLVPRPETETVVERALGLLAADPDGLVVEAGTGSGAIAIALASECPNPIVATDRSASALEVAVRNAARHLSAGRLAFVRGDWLVAFADRRAALVVSNPPYLAADDPHLAALAGEPRDALVSGPDGLEAIEALARQARRVLVDGGSLLVEHGATQGAATRTALRAHGFEGVCTVTDLAGHERVSEGRLPRDDASALGADRAGETTAPPSSRAARC